MKIVCDTNVLVSGFLFGGYPRSVLSGVREGRWHGCISIPMTQELERVLLYPRFGLSAEEVAAFVELVRETFELVSPTEEVNEIKDDPADNAILAAALAAKADAIISGDHHLLNLGVFRGINIVSPAEFMNYEQEAARIVRDRP